MAILKSELVELVDSLVSKELLPFITYPSESVTAFRVMITALAPSTEIEGKHQWFDRDPFVNERMFVPELCDMCINCFIGLYKDGSVRSHKHLVKTPGDITQTIRCNTVYTELSGLLDDVDSLINQLELFVN